jgi:hypothetical protein
MNNPPASQQQFQQPSFSDSFGQSMVNTLWPGSGYAGAAQSPYLPIVQPLLQSYSPMMDALTQTMQPMGPANVSTPGGGPPGQDGGKGGGADSTLMKGIDPVMSASMGK